MNKITLKRLNNRYFYAALVFFIWIMFFDRYSIITRIHHWTELKDQKKQIEYYHHEINQDNEFIKMLMTDNASLERFAREQYMMKKDNEDVFVVVEKTVED